MRFTVLIVFSIGFSFCKTSINGLPQRNNFLFKFVQMASDILCLFYILWFSRGQLLMLLKRGPELM